MKTFALVILIVLLVGAVVVVAYQLYGLIKAIIAKRKAKKAEALEKDNRKE